MYDSDKRKLLSLLCHGAIFLSTLLFSIGVPIAVLLVSDDPVVKDNAKEAINFHLNVWLYSSIIAVLTIITFGLAGFVLIPLGYLVHWGLTIFAILHVLQNPNQPYRYPFIFRLF
ncbi:MAG: DUF4870 domain-containing protein [Oscillatoriales cyanobacterium]|nr:MAG: DUF4870 domain-containing protein [Oscillatoriales cyanobacterium]TAD96189.1 MAG: DUF4870 domain-containing protein [Oscillatoriales cyanobacterium]TAE04115.1 MAG: DUF4870 domain-containing protein [Oscillatoriales cyanobacterium]TAF06907.1 MAG: DUF4870 domain-containing protein [Oscillatoriales cyanobacterium]TAF37743.1 MAG: DUF4870 domain-containing protein [Oscillatoriales cyanobacterium]